MDAAKLLSLAKELIGLAEELISEKNPAEMPLDPKAHKPDPNHPWRNPHQR